MHLNLALEGVKKPWKLVSHVQVMFDELLSQDCACMRGGDELQLH